MLYKINRKNVFPVMALVLAFLAAQFFYTPFASAAVSGDVLASHNTVVSDWIGRQSSSVHVSYSARADWIERKVSTDDLEQSVGVSVNNSTLADWIERTVWNAALEPDWVDRLLD